MALALHAAGATNRLHTTRRHVQTHRSTEVGHGSYSDAYTGHYTCSTARAPDDILVFNDGTVLQGTADDLCNPAVYVLLLRRDAPAEVAAATDAGLLADNTNTVFGPRRADTQHNTFCLFNAVPSDGTDHRLSDGVLGMHVAACRAAAYRLRINVCVYPTLTYTRICTALAGVGPAGLDVSTVRSLLGYPRQTAMRRQSRGAGESPTVRVLTQPLPHYLQDGLDDLFQTECVVLPANLNPGTQAVRAARRRMQCARNTVCL
jgi:hypothetical protein